MLAGVSPLIGVEVLLMGVMLPELLGVVMFALEAPLLPALLPRGTKSIVVPGAGELSGLLAALSRGADMGVFCCFGRPLRTPMLESALPPAYDGLLLQQLHPVKKMPRLHAPIRPAKGILPIVLSSPV